MRLASQTPATPNVSAMIPGKITSTPHGGRKRSSHACAYDELARYALQFAEYARASLSDRPKPRFRWSETYGRNGGTTSARETTAAVATAVQYARSVQRRPVAATTSTAKPIISVTNTP